MQRILTCTVLLVALLTMASLSAQAGCRGLFCAGIDRRIASWVGHPVQDLIATWGVPQGIFPWGDGGTMVIYQQTIVAGNGRWQQIRTFFVDRRGIIISYQWRGL